MTCNDPGQVENGTRIGTVPTPYGEVVSYTCYSGFYISVGQANMTCQADGTWMGSQPICASEFYFSIQIYKLNINVSKCEFKKNIYFYSDIYTPLYTVPLA